MYVFGPDNYGADSVRSISTKSIHIHVSARLCCCELYGSTCWSPLDNRVCRLNLENSFATGGMDILDSTYDSQYPTGPDVYSSPAYILH
jgi:hypothetical protein